MRGDLKWIVCQRQTPVLPAWAVLLFVTVSGCATPSLPPLPLPVCHVLLAHPAHPVFGNKMLRNNRSSSSSSSLESLAIASPHGGTLKSESVWLAMIAADTRFKDESDIYLMNYPTPYVDPTKKFKTPPAMNLAYSKFTACSDSISTSCSSHTAWEASS